MTESESPIQWHTSLEEYFASTGEKANCLAWCHKKAETLYSNRRTFIDLPVIVISAVTGFLSAGSTSLFNDAKVSSIALGVASLFVSVLNTAGSYFGWAKRAEGHRISAIHYSKLYRALMVELGLPREERQHPASLLKSVRDQYDRLQEVSPLIPTEVIREFQVKFEKYKDISKPEETNGLEHITIYLPTGINAGGSNLSIRSPGGTPTGLQVLRGRQGGFSEASEPDHGSASGEGTSSGGQGTGHQIILPERQRHEEGNPDTQSNVLP